MAAGPQLAGKYWIGHTGSFNTAGGMLRTFYVGLAVSMAIIVIVGFWPSYFGVLFSGQEYQRHWIFHVHAVVFMTWMGLLIGQTWLVHRRRTGAHMAVGPVGFGVATAVFVLGVTVSFVLMLTLWQQEIVSDWPGALWAASAPLTDISQFAVLATLGWAYRRKPQFHKRYMVLATVALLPAATARLGYLLGAWSLELMFAVIVGLIVMYDLRSQKRVHTANVIGIFILLPRVALNISYKFM